MIRRVGDFELLERLAVGGMSEVYRARHTQRPGEPLVLKLLLPQVAKDPTFVEMFTDEARLAEKLHHENLVRVVAWGEADGERYLALEEIRGCSLAAVLAARREAGAGGLEAAVAFALMERLLAALSYVHGLSDEQGRGLEAVHRDVTPGNILLSRRGEVKLADFGIARHRLRKSRTKTGVVKGTLQYMAPEQIADDRVDRRTDVYAAGLILFELLTGRPYLEAEREVELLTLVADPPPRAASELVAELGPEVDALLAPALERFPEQRYRDAGAFAEALGRHRRTHGGDLDDHGAAAAIAALVAEAGGSAADEVRPTVALQALQEDRGAPQERTETQHRQDPKASPQGRWLALGGIFAALAVTLVVLLAGQREPSRSSTAGRSGADAAAVSASAPDAALPGQRVATGIQPRRFDAGPRRDHSRPALPSTKNRTRPRPRPTKARRPASTKASAKAIPESSPKTGATAAKAAATNDSSERQRRELQRQLAALRQRGILSSDLDAATRGALNKVRTMITQGDAQADKALATLGATLAALRVSGPLVKAKLARVHRRLKKATPAKSKALAGRQSQALAAYMDGRLDAANAHLNAILKALKAP